MSNRRRTPSLDIPFGSHVIVPKQHIPHILVSIRPLPTVRQHNPDIHTHRPVHGPNHRQWISLQSNNHDIHVRNAQLEKDIVHLCTLDTLGIWPRWVHPYVGLAHDFLWTLVSSKVSIFEPHVVRFTESSIQYRSIRTILLGLFVKDGICFDKKRFPFQPFFKEMTRRESLPVSGSNLDNNTATLDWVGVIDLVDCLIFVAHGMIFGIFVQFTLRSIASTHKCFVVWVHRGWNHS
mmetsp:Transcript_26692/g.40938  ORF Transcript_26692/g.40938 Transcript_26692/m.40938 type:complete len:235 (+) Transcript_26692:395-1099(+)